MKGELLVKCISYVRVSTDEQAREGFSISSQSELNNKFIESQGWELLEHYIDDGYSAKDLNRPSMQRLITDAKNKKFDVVVFYKLDRLVRSVSDLDTLLQIFDANNIAIRSVTEAFDTTTAMGRFLINLVASMAQWERETISERVSVNMQQKAKIGEWPGGIPPYGYNLENEKLVIDPEESKIVKEVFKLSRTLGFYSIAIQLSKRGIPTRYNGEWHVDTVRGIANNLTYAGYIRYNEGGKNYKKPPREQTYYEGNHEPIIDRVEFWALQDILDKRRTFGGKREVSDYYFSSILICNRCGSSISGHRGGKGQKTYRCSGKKAGKSCTSHIFLEENLVKSVFLFLNDYIKQLDYSGDEVKTDNDFTIEITHEIKQIEKLLKKKKVMYENDLMDIDELIAETQVLRSREKELKKELSTIQNSNNDNKEILNIIKNIDMLWQDADDYDRKTLMTTIFKRIVVDTIDDYRGSKYPREVIIVSAK